MAGSACVSAMAHRLTATHLHGKPGAGSGSVSPHLGGFFFSFPVHAAGKLGAEFSEKKKIQISLVGKFDLAARAKAAVGEAVVSRCDAEPPMKQAGAWYV